MTDAAERLNAALDGRYRIERQLGEGGMATVYLADDLRHERKVALKVLKPELAAVVGGERFLAEIKTTANLQHPHILPLFDSGEADSFLFYVMPYVEGESLRERLDREHQLPVNEAVQIAKNVAEALEYAHSRGVIHRDIKPANILLQAGKPVVSDFGIALALGAAGGGRLTETGLSLGTPHYMSPEQATGDLSVGPSTDLYALGCVLYEMLVGEPPFTGSTPQAVLGKIVTGEAPSATAERKSVPPQVDAAIRRALEKVPADRFGRASAFVAALGDPGFHHAASGSAAARRPKGSAGLLNPLSIVTSLVAVAALIALVWSMSGVEQQTSDPVRRLHLPMRADLTISASGGGAFAASPDGSAISYVGRLEDGSRQIWLQRLDALEPVPVQGTESARGVVFSPDGSSVAFRAGQNLRTASLGGGPVNTVLDDVSATSAQSVAWGPDGWLYFVRSGQGIWRVPETGGSEEQVLPPEANGNDPTNPQALPNGRGLLFTRNLGTPSQDSIALLELETGEIRTLVQGAMARYAHSGHILYVTGDGTLLARPFDEGLLDFTGPARAIADEVTVNVGSTALFDISASGVLVYQTRGGGSSTGTPVWVDRDGSEEILDARLGGRFGRPAISPDGRRIAFEGSTDGSSGGPHIWIYDLERGGTLSPFTTEGTNQRPFWSPDGDQLGFSANREGFLGIYSRSSDGVGEARLLATTQLGDNPWEGEWSPGGELIYRHGPNIEGGDISFISDPPDGAVQPLMQTPAQEVAISLSPDGRWLAYEAVEGGESRVYVQPFPGPGPREVVDAGRRPLWARSGELFYKAPDNSSWIVAEVETDPFAIVSREVFGSTLDFTESVATHNYDVTPDGRRVLAIRQEDARQNPPVVVLNVFDELRQIAPPAADPN